MDKIVKAVKVMVNNEDKITNVLGNESEIFFMYLGKQKWSIIENDQTEYSLFYYPGEMDLEELMKMPPAVWSEYKNYAAFFTKDMNNEEKKYFKKLYNILTNKLYNMDNVFKEIKDNDDSEPIPF